MFLPKSAKHLVVFFLFFLFWACVVHYAQGCLMMENASCFHSLCPGINILSSFCHSACGVPLYNCSQFWQRGLLNRTFGNIRKMLSASKQLAIMLMYNRMPGCQMKCTFDKVDLQMNYTRPYTYNSGWHWMMDLFVFFFFLWI